MVADIIQHPAFKAERVASVKQFGMGGAPVPPPLLTKLRELTGNLSGGQGYGLTETCGGIITNKGGHYLKNPTSTGRPLPFLVEVVIKAPETNKPVPNGQSGELCVRTALLFAR